MFWSKVGARIAIPVAALILTACAPPPPALGPQQSISERALLTVTADAAFPEGGFVLSPAGRTRLDQILPSLQTLPPNAKIVVYGYTDNVPVGPELQSRGIADNLDLS